MYYILISLDEYIVEYGLKPFPPSYCLDLYFLTRIILEKYKSVWVGRVWKQQLGYVHIFPLLAKGWISFIFQSTNDKDNVVEGKWYWDNSIISLEN